MEREFGDRKARVLAPQDDSEIEQESEEIKQLRRDIEGQKKKITSLYQTIKGLELANFALQKQVEHQAIVRQASSPSLPDLGEKVELQRLRDETKSAINLLRREREQAGRMFPHSYKDPSSMQAQSHGEPAWTKPTPNPEDFSVERQITLEIERDILDERRRYAADRDQWQARELELQDTIDQLRSQLDLRVSQEVPFDPHFGCISPP